MTIRVTYETQDVCIAPRATRPGRSSCPGVVLIAYARIVHQYPDKTTTDMYCGTNADGPDSLDECVRRVKDLWRECCCDAPGEPSGEGSE